jgi:glycosyltransferase involved in cell wall biosynthesis
VVAESVGQNREMIRHAETGWLVEPGDVEAFAAAVLRLLEHELLARRIGEAAARDVRVRLSWDRLAATVEQAYGA